jgi:small subunit ribosomal protein S3Ae
MAKKVWYDIKAPAPFSVTQVCKTIVNKTVGTRNEDDNLKGRVFETSCGDLMNDETNGHQMVKLRVEDVKGRVGYTAFNGMRFTTDKLRSLVKKWHSQITAKTEVTTTDGYTLRVFSIGYTKRRQRQKAKTTYAKSSHVKKIGMKMKEIMNKTISGLTVKDFCNQLLDNLIGKQISRSCAGVFQTNW